MAEITLHKNPQTFPMLNAAEVQKVLTYGAVRKVDKDEIVASDESTQKRVSQLGVPCAGEKVYAGEIEALVVRMARENRDWGDRRIQGALFNLGHELARSTIAEILERHGIEPAPEAVGKPRGRNS